MKTKPTLIVLVLAIPVIVIAGFLFRKSREIPTYQGKTATGWLKEVRPLKKDEATEAMKEMGSEAEKAIRAALLTTNKNDRFKAVWAAKQLGTNGVALVPDLLQILSDPTSDQNLCFHSIRALGAIAPTDQRLIPVLTERLSDTNGSVSIAASILLEEVQSPQANPGEDRYTKAVTLLQSSTTTLRLQGLRIASELAGNDKRAVELLQSATNDANESVRANALVYLTRSPVKIEGRVEP